VDSREEAAPILIAKIECASTVPVQKWEVRTELRITYHPGPSGESRPITFHSGVLNCPTIYSGVVVGHSTQLTAVEGGLWDDPDMQISPGDQEDFETLHPGETWSSFVNHELPEDVQVGDSFRIQIRETKID
jgi:hypothetical protein